MNHSDPSVALSVVTDPKGAGTHRIILHRWLYEALGSPPRVHLGLSKDGEMQIEASQAAGFKVNMGGSGRRCGTVEIGMRALRAVRRLTMVSTEACQIGRRSVVFRWPTAL